MILKTIKTLTIFLFMLAMTLLMIIFGHMIYHINSIHGDTFDMIIGSLMIFVGVLNLPACFMMVYYEYKDWINYKI